MKLSDEEAIERLIQAFENIIEKIPNPEKTAKSEKTIIATIRKIVNEEKVEGAYNIKYKAMNLLVTNDKYDKGMMESLGLYMNFEEILTGFKFSASPSNSGNIVFHRRYEKKIDYLKFSIYEKHPNEQLFNKFAEVFCKIVIYIYKRMKWNHFLSNNSLIEISIYEEAIRNQLALHLLDNGFYSYSLNGTDRVFTLDKLLVDNQQKQIKLQNLLVQTLTKRNGMILNNNDVAKMKSNNPVENFSLQYSEDGKMVFFTQNKKENIQLNLQILDSDNIAEEKDIQSIQDLNNWINKVFKENEILYALEYNKLSYYYDWIQKLYDNHGYKEINDKLENKTKLDFSHLSLELLKIKEDNAFEIVNNISINSDSSNYPFFNHIYAKIILLKFTILNKELYLLYLYNGEEIKGEFFTETEMKNNDFKPVLQQYKMEIVNAI